jgi:hypothetical protein
MADATSKTSGVGFPRPETELTNLERFDAALVAFEESYQPLREIPVDSTCPDIALSRLGHEVLSGASNIQGVAEILRNVHEEARTVALIFFEEATRPLTDERLALHMEYLRHLNRVVVAYQSVFFFVRSFHDAIYRTFLWITGNRWGPKSSMKDAVKCGSAEDLDEALNTRHRRTVGTFVRGNPVAAVLESAVPEYPAWFSRWRHLRNEIKRGVPTVAMGMFRGRHGDFGLVIREAWETGGTSADMREVITLGDAAEALEVSARVARLASERRLSVDPRLRLIST